MLIIIISYLFSLFKKMSDLVSKSDKFDFHFHFELMAATCFTNSARLSTIFQNISAKAESDRIPVSCPETTLYISLSSAAISFLISVIPITSTSSPLILKL